MGEHARRNLDRRREPPTAEFLHEYRAEFV
jgi:hypothetical protein